MELEQLKTIWNEAEANARYHPKDIGPLLGKESHHPLMSLKKKFRRGMILVPISFAFVTNMLSRHHALLSDIIFWTYALFCLATTVYFIVSYRLVWHMMRAENNVLHHLHQQFNLLQKIFRWRRTGTRLMIAVFILLLEISLYFHLAPSLEQWYAQPLLLRLGAYTVAAALLYTIIHLSLKHRYEHYLLHLQNLISQLK